MVVFLFALSNRHFKTLLFQRWLIACQRFLSCLKSFVLISVTFGIDKSVLLVKCDTISLFVTFEQRKINFVVQVPYKKRVGNGATTLFTKVSNSFLLLLQVFYSNWGILSTTNSLSISLGVFSICSLYSRSIICS